jgi:cell division transport system permease protein
MARKESRSRGGARPRRIRLVERWRSWRRHHSQSAADSLAGVLRQPLASVMTWLVIGIAIALPSGLWVVLDNIARVDTQLETPAQLSVFLNDAVDRQTGENLAQSLRLREDLARVSFVDRDSALAEFVEHSGMGDLAASLARNPLPHLLLILPRDDSPAGVDALGSELAAMPEVQEVVLDTLWLRRLESLMALGRRAVQLLAGLLLLAVVLVLGNTIRLAIESRRDEIVIIKLVGGTDAFVRRPLLYTGLWFGLGGGAVAALLVALGTLVLASPVNELAAAYQSDFLLQGLGMVDSLQLLLLGAILGLAGAWLAVARHLKAIEPR